ncbi:MAG TPA: hypothetical protein VNG29_00365 [Candidatus Paceibacterota bacterium]|nr:hypothetical protein [Candidatus Paceibacterota bacterium]
MDLDNIFKQLKSIEPDPAFKHKSLHLILHSAPAGKPTLREIIFKSVEFGAAIALAGVLIYTAVGGFSAPGSSPLQISNFNPASLKAEAQAVDMQIQLVNLSYDTGSIVGATSSAASTPSVASPASGLPVLESPVTAPSSPAATVTSSVSVDQALNALSQ